LISSVKHSNFYPTFWSPFAFGGSRFSQNEGQENTQQITQGFKQSEGNQELLIHCPQWVKVSTEAGRHGVMAAKTGGVCSSLS
jgi:hypothetical protein